MEIIVQGHFSFILLHCRVVFWGKKKNSPQRVAHSTLIFGNDEIPTSCLVYRWGNWGESDLPKVTEGLVNHRPSDLEGNQELIFFNPYPQLLPEPHPALPTPSQPPTPIPGEDLYLVIDVIVISKYQQASDESSQEWVHLVGLTLHMGLQGAKPLVGEHEEGQVGRVDVRGLQDGLKLLSEAA